MSRMVTSSFGATNPTTSTSDTNAKFVAVTTATKNTGTGGINEENLRTEAIDTRQLSGAPICLWSDTQYNAYVKQLGSAGETYASYANSGTKEQAIDHGSDTKLAVSTGIAVVAGDIVRLDWTVVLWDIDNHDSLDLLPGATIRVTGAEGSGLGEWCFLIYPKVDTTDVGLTHFVSLNGISTETVVDPGSYSAGQGNGFRCDGTSHISVVPIHYLQAYQPSANVFCAAYYARGSSSTNTHLRPRVIRGSYWFTVKTPATIYGFQLFTSGVWRLETDGTNQKFYLEGDVCDPTGTPKKYGVSDGIVLERAKLGATIYRNV